jgi:hypothetical protein
VCSHLLPPPTVSLFPPPQVSRGFLDDLVGVGSDAFWASRQISFIPFEWQVASDVTCARCDSLALWLERHTATAHPGLVALGLSSIYHLERVLRPFILPEYTSSWESNNPGGPGGGIRFNRDADPVPAPPTRFTLYSLSVDDAHDLIEKLPPGLITGE